MGDPTEAAFLAAEHNVGNSEAASERKECIERIGEVPFTGPGFNA